MTREEAIQYLEGMRIDRFKGYDSFGEFIKERNEALDMAISALSVIEQTKWERDTALATLEEHGIGLGQRAEPSDLISRADAVKIVYEKYPYDANQAICDDMIFAINKLPSVSAERVIRCKDCEYRDKTKVNKKGFEVCVASGMDITDNDFCSLAKMKGGAE